MIASIMEHGVIDAVKVVRDGPTLYVHEGRQRTKNCREANRRLRKAGSKPVQIRYIAIRAAGAKSIGISASSFIRTPDAPTSRAKKMLKQREYGYTDAQIGVDFGVSASVVKSTIALLDAAPAVQRAVDHGELPATVGRTLAKLPRAEQGAALAKMKEEGATKGKRAEAAALRVTGPAGDESGAPERPKMLGAKAIAGIAKRLRSHPFDGGYQPSVCAAMVLDYVTGKSADFVNYFRWHATGEGKEPKPEAMAEVNGGGRVDDGIRACPAVTADA